MRVELEVVRNKLADRRRRTTDSLLLTSIPVSAFLRYPGFILSSSFYLLALIPVHAFNDLSSMNGARCHRFDRINGLICLRGGETGLATASSASRQSQREVARLSDIGLLQMEQMKEVDELGDVVDIERPSPVL